MTVPLLQHFDRAAEEAGGLPQIGNFTSAARAAFGGR
jgi:hypothetical protein